jgi:hypothetical protein
MMRCVALVLGTLLISAACHVPDEPVADAAVVVVEDLLPRAPEGYTPYLASEWQIPRTDSIVPIPAAVLEEMRQASGLPLAGGDLIRGRNPDIAVLYLFRPQVLRPDSVLVAGGWMRLTTGDGGGAWGEEYSYRLDCRRGCRIMGEPRTMSWN